MRPHTPHIENIIVAILYIYTWHTEENSIVHLFIFAGIVVP